MANRYPATHASGTGLLWFRLQREVGRETRELIAQHGQTVFGIALNPDSSSAARWDIQDHEGGMVSLGVGGPLTGRGANCFVIDDPIKNAEEAHSATYREKIWSWFQSVAYTRLEPGLSQALNAVRKPKRKVLCV